MLEALRDRLLEKPTLYLDDIAIFLWDEFALQATKASISRALRTKGWSEKTAQLKAQARHLIFGTNTFTLSQTSSLPPLGTISEFASPRYQKFLSYTTGAGFCTLSFPKKAAETFPI